MTATPGQTIGPFFGFALPRPDCAHVVPPGHPGALLLTGRVRDGCGSPVPDALVEICQPEGWARSATDGSGRYGFTTVRPRAPFIAVAVFARGLLDRLFTRIYLPGSAPDERLASLPPERVRTLCAVEDGPDL